ncbi:hypothetical protein KUL25_07655 [Rhodobacteraceae bacterium N5(2021)]|uniref:Uncharacterized protein n=1 Tax=Gymnodinialimonas phycosphaerae TaxID=2841589 RepID=A0A975TZ57_9RHOB|nr:hypothetical protein [Gymnodinialimonas phycosphaerae]MBY4892638.1 hypothetical protein [Gymnodinialimonas phycosphaerae]
MRVLKPFITGAVFALASATFVTAQEVESVPITLSSIAIERYAELTESDADGGVACCAPVVLHQPGHHFVYVRAIYDVAWTEEIDRVNVSFSDIGLQLPGDAEPRQMVGRMAAVGEFQLSGTSLTARRPRDWPDETEQAYLNAVFLVPETITSGTLVFQDTDYSQEISLEAEVTELIDPASLLEVNVLALTEVDEVAIRETSGRQDITGRLAATLGSILQLDVSVQPMVANDIDGDNSFFFNITDFTLVGPDNAPLHLIGTVPNNSLQDSYSYSSSWDPGSLPRSQSIRFYFAGNAAPGVYKVFYLGTPMADLMFE